MINRHLASLALLLLVTDASADFGAVNPAYGDSGVASRPIASHPLSTSARGLAVTADDRLYQAVVAFSTGGGRQSFLVRYLQNGLPDPAFGSGGLLALQEPASAREWSQMTVLPGNNGFLLNDYNAPTVFKFFSNGAIDPSYGDSGAASDPQQPIGSGWTMGTDSSGRSVISGLMQTQVTPSNSVYTPTLSRLLPSGDLDTSFGNQGRLAAPLGPVCMRAQLISFDGMGRILVAGPADLAGGQQCQPKAIAVFRLTAGGQLDTSFGANGLARIALGDQVQAGPIRIAADGTLSVLANSVVDAFGTIGGHLVRLTADGQPITSFGTAGVVSFPIYNVPAGVTSEAWDYSAALFSNGDFAVGALLENGTTATSAAVRIGGCSVLSATGSGSECRAYDPDNSGGAWSWLNLVLLWGASATRRLIRRRAASQSR